MIVRRAGLVPGVVIWLLSVAALAHADGRRIVLPVNVVPTHYDIAVVPDSAHLSFAGSVTIDLDIVVSTREITLNAADLKILQVKVAGETARPEIAVDDKNQTLTFKFPAAIPAGHRQLSIDYTGKIFEQASGLFALDYGSGKRKKRALFTQFENSDARRFVPCWDEPNRKATFDLTVTVPSNDLAVSNMPVATSERAGRGLKRVHFGRSPKMSTYLLYFSTGDMERVTRRVGKVELGVVVKRGERARAGYALDAAARILPFYEDYFGVAYPLPKLDFIAGPGSSQFFGAMENWGAIFYFESELLVDAKTSTERDRRNVFSNVAHEMAHQWFGNLVTMDWWDDLWLNEGFATWMAFKASDRFHPEWNVMLDMVRSRDRAMERDARVGTHAVVQPVLDVLQASQAFDSITYSKGSAVIRMLEDYVGASAFRDGVRAYIKAHAYGNAVTDDLWRELDKGSDAPVSAIAHDFTLQEGVPLIGVAPAGNGVRLSQSRFALDASGAAKLTWRVPVIASAAGAAPWRGIVTRDAGADVPVAASHTVIVNAGQSGYYRVLFEPSLFAKLAAEFSALSAPDQLGLIYDTRMLGYSGDAPLSNLLALADRATAKLHPLVLMILAERLGGIDDFYKGLGTQSAYRAFGRKVLQPVFAEVGWMAKRHETANQALLRAALLEALSKLDDGAVVAEARRRFARFFARPTSLEAEERRSVLSIAARHADGATWERFHTLAQTAQSNVEKERYYTYLGRAVDIELAKRALALTLSDEIAVTTRPAILDAVSKEFPDLAFDFVNEHRDVVMGWLETTSRDLFVPDLLAAGQDEALIGKLKAYAAKYIPDSARRAADVAAGQIALNIAIRSKRLPDADQWLKAHGY